MNWTPILTASPLMQIHLVTVVTAIILTFPILTMKKGTRRHKALGRIWVAAMLITAISSFGIQTSGGLSFIHIFSVMTLLSAPYAVWSARRGRIEAHRSAMLSLTFGGIGIAGAFAFGEGRLLHAAIWGG